VVINNILVIHQQCPDMHQQDKRLVLLPQEDQVYLEEEPNLNN
jgi:hypothetical protein